MLPTRAYADPLPPFSTGARAEPLATDARPTLILAVAAAEIDRFPSAPFARFAARTTGDAIRLIERWRPRVVALDWDLADFDGREICAAARTYPGTGTLV